MSFYIELLNKILVAKKIPKKWIVSTLIEVDFSQSESKSILTKNTTVTVKITSDLGINFVKNTSFFSREHAPNKEFRSLRYSPSSSPQPS